MNWWQKLVLGVVSRGPVPQHMAFIMDGNRRYARKEGLESAIKGHEKGLDTLNEVVRCLLLLGVRWATIFAFSQDNFNRSTDEIESMMDLVQRTFRDDKWIQDFVNQNQIKLRLCGDVELADAQTREILLEAQRRTKDNTGMILTVCFAYSSKNELVGAIQKAAEDPEAEGLDDESGEDGGNSEERLRSFAQLYNRNLGTGEIPPPDVLIRTSGETRLSDFLAWQISERTSFYFLPSLWPEVTPWDIVCCVLRYQCFSTGTGHGRFTGNGENLQLCWEEEERLEKERRDERQNGARSRQRSEAPDIDARRRRRHESSRNARSSAPRRGEGEEGRRPRNSRGSRRRREGSEDSSELTVEQEAADGKDEDSRKRDHKAIRQRGVRRNPPSPSSLSSLEDQHRDRVERKERGRDRERTRRHKGGGEEGEGEARDSKPPAVVHASPSPPSSKSLRINTSSSVSSRSPRPSRDQSSASKSPHPSRSPVAAVHSPPRSVQRQSRTKT